ncbi:MAG TPA: hypothetical protein VFC07_08900 [Verrucomicrobiae bacterium]|nr:hypothetical protein [Verrucomicrobiae bacterium]
MNGELSIIQELVLDWPKAIEKPEIARAVILQKKTFKDEKNRRVVQELLLANGDVHRAVQALQGSSLPWLAKFVKWVDKIRGVK